MFPVPYFSSPDWPLSFQCRFRNSPPPTLHWQRSISFPSPPFDISIEISNPLIEGQSRSSPLEYRLCPYCRSWGSFSVPLPLWLKHNSNKNSLRKLESRERVSVPLPLWLKHNSNENTLRKPWDYWKAESERKCRRGRRERGPLCVYNRVIGGHPRSQWLTLCLHDRNLQWG